MKSLLKKVIPESGKRALRRLENVWLRAGFGFRRPVILEDAFGIKFMFYPHDGNPIRWQLEAGTNSGEFIEIQKRTKEGDIFFDVGANVGLITALASKAVGPSGRVYAFEPHPHTVLELKKTVAINECGNVTVENVALSSQEGTADFYFVPNHKLNSLGPIADTTYGENQVMQVATTTIDAYCALHGIRRIDFLKIDVEGFEQSVLEGAAGMLAGKSIGCIQFEMHETNPSLLSLLAQHGYRVEEKPSGFNWYAQARA